MLPLALLLVPAALVLASLRLYWIVAHRPPPARRALDDSCSVAVFLGSGGHTHEMLSVLRLLDRSRYSRRLYVHVAGDGMSVRKAASLELDFARADGGGCGLDGRPPGSSEVELVELPRARAVGQPLWSAAFTTAWTLLVAVWRIALHPRAPFADVLLLNGPGTCVPLVLAVWVARFVGRPTPRIIYLESFARTTSLSLTGRLLARCAAAERIAVQWETVQAGEFVSVVV